MTFLLLELILADQVASTVIAHFGRSTDRSTPLVVASSGQQWQYEISTIRAYIGRSSAYYCYSSYWQINWQIYPQ